jgi:hypothetical protein
MASAMGPEIAVGDVNNDKLDDIFICGGPDQPGELYVQRPDGSFTLLVQPHFTRDAQYEDVSASFVDVDNDGDLDLVVGAGGHNSRARAGVRLYANGGQGNFSLKDGGLPDVDVQVSCVRPADFDGDGDQDIFIGSPVLPGHYGRSPRSYLFENTGNGFVDITDRKLSTHQLGMINDACWTDINGDGRLDLIVVGEWMPITIFIQTDRGSFSDETKLYNMENTNGMWNTIFQTDLDHDGVSDFLLGNLGENSRLRASEKLPVSLYISDLDQNASDDPILTYFNGGRQYPFISRDQLIKQVPSMKKKFVKYKDFKNVTINQLISNVSPADIVRKDIFSLSSGWLRMESGKLTFRKLPASAQMFPIYAFEVIDFDDDGEFDVIAIGNKKAFQPDIGQHDAGYGIVLHGDGTGKLKPLEQTGFFVAGEGRDIKQIRVKNNKELILVTANNDSLRTFKIN